MVMATVMVITMVVTLVTRMKLKTFGGLDSTIIFESN